MYTEKMPKSLREELAVRNMREAIFELFAAKMEDLGSPDWSIENQGDFWESDSTRSTLAKDSLRSEMCKVLFEIRVNGNDDNSELG